MDIDPYTFYPSFDDYLYVKETPTIFIRSNSTVNVGRHLCDFW